MDAREVFIAVLIFAVVAALYLVGPKIGPVPATAAIVLIACVALGAATDEVFPRTHTVGE